MKYFPYILLIGILFSSFNNKKPKPYTGFILKEFEKSLVLIPKGNFNLGQNAQESYAFEYGNYDRYFSSFYEFTHMTNDSMAEFYLSNTEVSNGQYLEFINEIRIQDTSLYNQLLPDTTVWRAKGISSEVLVELYFRHPFYSHYPVVGISYEQANHFCNWLTEKYLLENNRT